MIATNSPRAWLRPAIVALCCPALRRRLMPRTNGWRDARSATTRQRSSGEAVALRLRASAVGSALVEPVRCAVSECDLAIGARGTRERSCVRRRLALLAARPCVVRRGVGAGLVDARRRLRPIAREAL